MAVSGQQGSGRLLPAVACVRALPHQRRLLPGFLCRQLHCAHPMLLSGCDACALPLPQQVLVAEGGGHAGLPDCGHRVRGAGRHHACKRLACWALLSVWFSPRMLAASVSQQHFQESGTEGVAYTGHTQLCALTRWPDRRLGPHPTAPLPAASPIPFPRITCHLQGDEHLEAVQPAGGAPGRPPGQHEEGWVVRALAAQQLGAVGMLGGLAGCFATSSLLGTPRRMSFCFAVC